jgi:uncharacterized membrane protein
LKLQRTIDYILELLEDNEINIKNLKLPKQGSANKYQEQYVRKSAAVEEFLIQKSIKKSVSKKQAIINKKERPKISFEKQLGERLPVWIGGVALALSGFFLVKYSIEQSLISPSIRIAMGAIFGTALLYGAKWVRVRPNFANGVRISQSLAGAGIAVLYLASYASVNLYHLIRVH